MSTIHSPSSPPDHKPELARIRKLSLILGYACLAIACAIPLMPLLAIGLAALTGAPVPSRLPLPSQEPLSAWMLATLGILNVLPMIFLVIGLWTARACFKRFARGVLRRLRHSGPAQVFHLGRIVSGHRPGRSRPAHAGAFPTFSAGALLHCVFGPLADADVRGDAVGDGGDDQPRPVIGGRKRSVRMTKFIHRRHGRRKPQRYLRVREDLQRCHGGQGWISCGPICGTAH